MENRSKAADWFVGFLIGVLVTLVILVKAGGPTKRYKGLRTGLNF